MNSEHRNSSSISSGSTASFLPTIDPLQANFLTDTPYNSGKIATATFIDGSDEIDAKGMKKLVVREPNNALHNPLENALWDTCFTRDSDAATPALMEASGKHFLKRMPQNGLYTSRRYNARRHLDSAASVEEHVSPSVEELYTQKTRSFFFHTAPVHLFQFSPPRDTTCCLSPCRTPALAGAGTDTIEENASKKTKKQPSSTSGISFRPSCSIPTKKGCCCQRPLKSFDICGCPNEWTMMDMDFGVPSPADTTREKKTEEEKKGAINGDKDHREGDDKVSSKFPFIVSKSSFFPAPSKIDVSTSRIPSSSSSFSSSTLDVRRSVEVGDKGGKEKKGASEKVSSCPACPPPFVRSLPDPGSSLYSAEALRLTIPPLSAGQPQVPSSVCASTPLCRRGPRSLPRSIKDSPPPLAKGLHQLQQDKPAFRDAVARQQAALLPYMSCIPEELKSPITEYFCSAQATHLFHYLREDLLYDRPADPIPYMADWVKRYRSLFGGTQTD